jgi:hypothetical protein
VWRLEPFPSISRNCRQHRPERVVLLAVDQELREGASRRVPPVRADPFRPLEVREHEDAEPTRVLGRDGGDEAMVWMSSTPKCDRSATTAPVPVFLPDSISALRAPGTRSRPSVSSPPMSAKPLAHATSCASAMGPRVLLSG